MCWASNVIVCFLAANRLSLRIGCSAPCVIKSYFYILFCSAHVQQLSHWRSCTVAWPRILHWGTGLERLRTSNWMVKKGWFSCFANVIMKEINHESSCMIINHESMITRSRLQKGELTKVCKHRAFEAEFFVHVLWPVIRFWRLSKICAHCGQAWWHSSKPSCWKKRNVFSLSLKHADRHLWFVVARHLRNDATLPLLPKAVIFKPRKAAHRLLATINCPGHLHLHPGLAGWRAFRRNCPSACA